MLKKIRHIWKEFRSYSKQCREAKRKLLQFEDELIASIEQEPDQWQKYSGSYYGIEHKTKDIALVYTEIAIGHTHYEAYIEGAATGQCLDRIDRYVRRWESRRIQAFWQGKKAEAAKVRTDRLEDIPNRNFMTGRAKAIAAAKKKRTARNGP